MLRRGNLMRTPYGYTRCEPETISVNPEQAAVIRLIYELYLQGKSLGGIAAVLKEQGIPSPTGKPVWVRALSTTCSPTADTFRTSFQRIYFGKRNMRKTADQIWNPTTEQERPPGTTHRTY